VPMVRLFIFKSAQASAYTYHGTSRVTVQRDPWLNPENQTTKSRRHEEVKNQLALFFVPS
jgi:hypothetical protein